MKKELPVLLSDPQTTEHADWFIIYVKKKNLMVYDSLNYYKIDMKIPFDLEFRIQNNTSTIIIKDQEIIDVINFSYFSDGHVNLKSLDIHDKNILYQKFFTTNNFKYSFNYEFGHFVIDHSENNFESIFQIYQHLMKFTFQILVSDYFQSTTWKKL
jgi:hypothetical protein